MRARTPAACPAGPRRATGRARRARSSAALTTSWAPTDTPPLATTTSACATPVRSRSRISVAVVRAMPSRMTSAPSVPCLCRERPRCCCRGSRPGPAARPAAPARRPVERIGDPRAGGGRAPTAWPVAASAATAPAAWARRARARPRRPEVARRRAGRDAPARSRSTGSRPRRAGRRRPAVRRCPPPERPRRHRTGMSAPVRIRIAVPAATSCRRARARPRPRRRPAADRALAVASATSTLRTANPSIAELSHGGSVRSERTSAAAHARSGVSERRAPRTGGQRRLRLGEDPGARLLEASARLEPAAASRRDGPSARARFADLAAHPLERLASPQPLEHLVARHEPDERVRIVVGDDRERRDAPALEPDDGLEQRVPLAQGPQRARGTMTSDACCSVAPPPRPSRDPGREHDPDEPTVLDDRIDAPGFGAVVLGHERVERERRPTVGGSRSIASLTRSPL